MRPIIARRAILVLATIALLFTLDAAYEARLAPSLIIALVFLAGGLAWALVRLAELAISGVGRRRRVAIATMNVTGALPTIAMLWFVGDALQGRPLMLAMQATIVWLLAVLLWTTSVLVSAPGRPHRAETAAPAREPIPPRSRPARRAATHVLRAARSAQGTHRVITKP